LSVEIDGANGEGVTLAVAVVVVDAGAVTLVVAAVEVVSVEVVALEVESVAVVSVAVVSVVVVSVAAGSVVDATVVVSVVESVEPLRVATCASAPDASRPSATISARPRPIFTFRRLSLPLRRELPPSVFCRDDPLRRIALTP
jgi:hypothetical protein